MARTAFITGASAGFGRACAKRFADQGFKLVVCARRQDRLVQLQQELADQCDMHLIGLDVSDRRAVQEAVDGIPDSFKKIDVLVNNAGLALGLEPAHAADLDDWETMIDVNNKGMVYVTRAVLPGMVDRGHGHVINLGSIAGTYPYPGSNVYGATKAFVRQFSLNLRADLSGTGVRVTSIEPGMAETEFSVVRFKGDQAKADQVYAGAAPLTGEDIAEAVLWATTQPAHVNINRIELMPTCQAWGHFAIHRDV